ncbi:PrgI family protein [Patescibacteria group bacterium]|nr:PrgI family protein [Patescibacteria group bacterium]
MEFQVPQFIEQKPKIVGPLTLIQFFYLAGAGAVSFIAYNLFNVFLWVIVTFIAFGAGIALAFVKINGQDMTKVLGSVVRFLFSSRVYTWQRQVAKTTLELSDEDLENLRKKMGIGERLKSLALKVSVGRVLSKDQPKENEEDKYEVVTYLTGERKVAKRIDY